MRGVFDDREFEPAKPRRDTELTLGAGTLLAIFFGLVVLCALCFGLGYSLGHRGATQAVTAGSQPAPGAPASLPVSGAQPKPSATGQASVPPPPQNTAGPPASTVPGAAQGAAQAATPQGSAPAAPAAPALSPAPVGFQPAQTQVHPALVPASNSVSPAHPAPAPNVQPATPQAEAAVVQIAAVSNLEDARVLVEALRKRGYPVTAVREPADNLIHIRIGPFANRNDANAVSKKLLSDGYNAIVLP